MYKKIDATSILFQDQQNILNERPIVFKNILSVPCPMRRSDRLVGLQNQGDYRDGQLVMWTVEVIMVAMMTMMKAAMFMVNFMLRVIIVVVVMVVTVRVVVVDYGGDGDGDGGDGDGDGVDGDGIDGDSDGVPARSSPIISLRNHSNDLDKKNISFGHCHQIEIQIINNIDGMLLCGNCWARTLT